MSFGVCDRGTHRVHVLNQSYVWWVWQLRSRLVALQEDLAGLVESMASDGRCTVEFLKLFIDDLRHREEDIRAKVCGTVGDMGGLRAKVRGTVGDMGGLRAKVRGTVGDMGGIRAKVRGTVGDMGGIRAKVRGTVGDMGGIRAKVCGTVGDMGGIIAKVCGIVGDVLPCPSHFDLGSTIHDSTWYGHLFTV